MNFDDLGSFMEAMEKVTGSDPTVDGFDFGPQVPKGVKRAREVIEGTSKTVSNDMIAEGIIEKGMNALNKLTNILPDSLKAKISSEWKHLNDDEKLTLLRIIEGDEKAYTIADSNIDVELAKAFKTGRLQKSENSEDPGIIVNEDIDLSRTSSEKWPSIRIEKVNGALKCNYSAFKSFARFPSEVTSLQMKGNKNRIKDFSYFPKITGRGEKNYAIDMTGTKIESLKGWNQKTAINGHVGFRDCDINDLLSGQGTIYIDGALDIRNNKNITPESLKAILLKGYRGGSIVVKGGILHTLDLDGYYDPKQVKSDVIDSQELGLMEASGRKPKRNPNTPVSQEYLWEIGDSILQMAANRVTNPNAKTTVETVRSAINPEVAARVRELVGDITSNPGNNSVLRQSSQELSVGTATDEIKKHLETLFAQLAKQLSSMKQSPKAEDTSRLEKTSAQIVSTVVDDASIKINEFVEAYEAEMNSESCPNFPALISKLEETIKSVPMVATKKLTKILDTLKKTHMTLAKNDKNAYDKALYGLLHMVNSELMDSKSEINEEDSTKIANKCFPEAPGVDPNAIASVAIPDEQPPMPKPILQKRTPVQVPNLKKRGETAVPKMNIEKEVQKPVEKPVQMKADFTEEDDDSEYIQQAINRGREFRNAASSKKKD